MSWIRDWGGRTGTVTEQAGQCGRYRTGNRERGVPEQVRSSNGYRRLKSIRRLEMCCSTGYYTWGRVPIQFGTYNIRNGRNGGLALALRGVSQANLDLGIFRETNLTSRFYTHGSSGYSVVAKKMRRADTAAEWLCSTGRHHGMRWRPFSSLVQMSSSSRWRRGSGDVTSSDVTSPPTTPR